MNAQVPTYDGTASSVHDQTKMTFSDLTELLKQKLCEKNAQTALETPISGRDGLNQIHQAGMDPLNSGTSTQKKERKAVQAEYACLTSLLLQHTSGTARNIVTNVINNHNVQQSTLRSYEAYHELRENAQYFEHSELDITREILMNSQKANETIQDFAARLSSMAQQAVTYGYDMWANALITLLDTSKLHDTKLHVPASELLASNKRNTRARAQQVRDAGGSNEEVRAAHRSTQSDFDDAVQFLSAVQENQTNKQNSDATGSTYATSMECSHCGRTGHTRDQCFSKTHVNGNKIDQLNSPPPPRNQQGQQRRGRGQSSYGFRGGRGGRQQRGRGRGRFTQPRGVGQSRSYLTRKDTKSIATEVFSMMKSAANDNKTKDNNDKSWQDQFGWSGMLIYHTTNVTNKSDTLMDSGAGMNATPFAEDIENATKLSGKCSGINPNAPLEVKAKGDMTICAKTSEGGTISITVPAVHIPEIPFRIISHAELETFYDKADITISTKHQKMIIKDGNGKHTVPLYRRGHHTFLKTIDCVRRHAYLSNQNPSNNNDTYASE